MTYVKMAIAWDDNVHLNIHFNSFGFEMNKNIETTMGKHLFFVFFL